MMLVHSVTAGQTTAAAASVPGAVRVTGLFHCGGPALRRRDPECIVLAFVEYVIATHTKKGS